MSDDPKDVKARMKAFAEATPDYTRSRADLEDPPVIAGDQPVQLKAASRLVAESYPGNIGVMEMVKFHRMATPEQKRQLKTLMDQKKFDKGWQLLQDVTGVKLH